MTKFIAHFDGEVIIPDEPVDLPVDKKFLIQIEDAPSSDQIEGIDGDEFAKAAQKLGFTKDELESISRAINQD